MGHRGRFISSTAALIALAIMMSGPSASAQDAAKATPESLFEELFGDKAREVAKSPATDDDLLFARGLIEAARTAKSNADLAVLLADKAYEAAMRAPEGFAVALQAVNWVIDNHPEQAESHRVMLRDAYQKRYSTARGTEKADAGSALLDLLTADADTLANDDKLEDASGVLRQALTLATALRSPRRDDVRAKLEGVNKQLITMRRIDQLKQSLKDNPDDTSKANDLIMLYVVDLDRPEEARRFTFLTKDDTLAQNIRDACKDKAEIDPERQLAMGEWYQSLGLQAAASTAKWSMLDRAAGYFEAYQHSGADDALKLTKAKLSLQRVRDLLDKLGPSARPITTSRVPDWAEGCVLALTFDTVRITGGHAFTTDSSKARQTVELFGGSADTGVHGKCLVLDGVDDYAQVTLPESIDLTGDLSVTFWINGTNFNERAHPFFKTWGGEGSMTIEKSGLINFYWGPSGADKLPYQGVPMQTTLPVGKWTHVMIVRDMAARQVLWYVNGQMTHREPTKFEKAGRSTVPILIGKGYTPNFLAAKLDDMAIWNRALTAEEVAEIYKTSTDGRSYCDMIAGRR
ncbi:MAG: hypothetical protein GC159_20440 [Phycisphaera sp.]|nr:hypothetical protein [Phycisphaera sp.]